MVNQLSPFGFHHRERLAEALKRLRLSAGLSGPQIAEQLGWSQSKVSKIENAHQKVAIPDVEAWLRVTGASEERREELLALAEDALVSATSWRKLDQTSVERQVATAELEQSAGTIRVFQPLIIPGLMQTPDYARQVRLARLEVTGKTEEPDELAAWVAAAMNRQTILYDQAKHFEFIIPEAALRWRYGATAMMLGQLDRIGVISTLPNVAIGLISQAAELPVWHTHGFVIFDDREDEGPHVHVEMLTGPLNIADPADVETFQEAFARLRGVALFGEDARALLRQIAEDMRPVED